MDPGFDFSERIRKGKKSIMDVAEKIPLPTAPSAPPIPEHAPQWKPITAGADEWNFWDDMSHDYTLEICYPPDYVWDGNIESVKNSVAVDFVNIDRWHGYFVIGNPWAELGKVKIIIHVGVDWQLSGKRGSIFVTFGANFVYDPALADQEYKTAYKDWQGQIVTWQQEVDAIRVPARKEAQTKAENWEAEILAKCNPLHELLNSLVKHLFPEAMRDESWEIDIWQNIFDWELASYQVYPSWWLDRPMRDCTEEPTYFLNASFAKLFLPIKPGYEQLALRWIFGKSLDSQKEAAFKKIQIDIERYQEKFEPEEDATGISIENVLLLGAWTECLPTDGTHLEVVQGITSAADEFSQKDIETSSNLKEAFIKGEKQNIEIKKKALSQITQAASVEVRINTEAKNHDKEG
jgi:hypothetical protein